MDETRTGEAAAGHAFAVGMARLELAAAAARMGIWDWDLATGRMDYSPVAREICGFAADQELTLDLVRQTVHPDDLPLTSAQAARALDPTIRDDSPYEYRVVRADGEVRWVLAHGKAVFGDGPEGSQALRYIGALQDVTERHRRQEQDRDDARRLQLAMEAGRMAVWELDLRRDVLTTSPELNRLFGFPDDAKPTPEQVREGYLPGERERISTIGQAVIARGERLIEAEYRYRRQDGAVRWLLLRCEVVFEGPAPTRAIGVIMDITDRRETEEALRTSQARFALAQKAAGAGVWDWDLQSGNILWSPEMYGFYGLSPDLGAESDGVYLYEAWLAAIHPEDRGAADTAVKDAIAAGRPLNVDFRVIEPDGEVRWIRSRASILMGPEGRAARVTGINTDVTDQHRQEERLRDTAEQRTRERDRMFELSKDLFAVAGLDGELRTINPAWSRLLGYSDAELRARPFGSFVHPEDRPAATEAFATLVSGQPVQRFEARLRRKDGGVVWIDWTAVPEGKLVYAVGRNVTRDRELEEAQRHSQKMEAMGQLTGGIAHDFNNLLQAVRGNLDLIARKPSDPERVSRWASQGLEAAERGAKLTAQLLAFSRAQKLELKPVHAAQLILGLRDLLQRSLGAMVQVRLDLEDGPDLVLADATQLELAVLNLAINARDAMPAGGEVLIRLMGCHLTEDPDLAPGDYFTIEVCDSGSGMPAEVQAKAFDPFFTTKPVGKGTGLGLSQVYGMARQAGGIARITSQLGEGTTVTVHLPCAAPSPDERAAQESAAPVVPEAPQCARRILVVDDDPDVRRFMVESLESLGYAVQAAGDGAAALSSIEQDAPDLLLVDFAMPGMSGAEVASAARDRKPDLPVIFATGYADTGAIDAAVGVGAVRLSKPFSMDGLAEAVAAALEA